MKVTDFLTEAVRVHSEGLLAFVITAAEAYAEKPALVPQDVFHWSAMIFANQNLLSKALSKIKIIPTPNDPYDGENAMIRDIVFNKQLKVFSGGGPHPVLTNQETVMFRAIHDFFAHAGTQTQSLKAFYDRQQLVTPQDAAELPPFAMSSHSFTIRGEMNAYLVHTKLSPPDAWAALFCEIIGQASYYFVTGDFPQQKVAALDGFDLRNLGICFAQREQRMQEILAIIQDPNQMAIQTHVNNVVLDKRRINWKLLSSGTASRQVESITEAGMGHIYQKAKGPFLVMSAWRGGYNRSQNRARNAQLRQQLFNHYGLASIQQRGYWPVEHDDQGVVQATGHEDSIFVPMNQPTTRIKHIDEFINLAKSLMVAYDQDAVIVGDGTTTHLLNNPTRPEGGPQERIGNALQVMGRHHPVDDAPGWSQKGNYKYVVANR